MLLVVLTLRVVVPFGSGKVSEEVRFDIPILFVFAEILLFEYPDFLGTVKLVFFLCFISFVFAGVANTDGFPLCCLTGILSLLYLYVFTNVATIGGITPHAFT